MQNERKLKGRKIKAKDDKNFQKDFWNFSFIYFSF